MIFGAARSARRRSRLLLGALLVLLSGCSLGVPSSEDSAPAFAGPPQIQIALPLADQTFLAGSTVIVQARIENAGPDLARISILLDDTSAWGAALSQYWRSRRCAADHGLAHQQCRAIRNRRGSGTRGWQQCPGNRAYFRHPRGDCRSHTGARRRGRRSCIR